MDGELLLTPADIATLKAHGVADIDDVPIFGTGQHHDDGHEFTDADLDEMDRNFARFSAGDNPLHAVALAVGHSKNQSWLRDSGYPAAGLIKRVWRDKTDGLLHASFNELPAIIADAIDAGALFRCSAEVYDRPPKGLPGARGKMLRRVALQGFDPTAVKRLLRIGKPKYRQGSAAIPHKEIPTRARRWRWVNTKRTGDGTFIVFSEVRVMKKNRAAATAKLQQAGYPESAIKRLAALSDAEFSAFAEEAVSAVADPPVEREMISQLVAKGEREGDLLGMEPADLLALYTQKCGPDDDKDDDDDDDSGSKGSRSLNHRERELRRVVSEATATAKRALADARMAETAAQRQAKIANESAVKVFCEQMKEERRLTPADIDPNSKVPNEYHAGIEAANSPTVFKFGEKSMTAFEAWKARVKARDPIHASKFQEKIGGGDIDGDEFADDDKRVDEWLNNRFGKRAQPSKN